MRTFQRSQGFPILAPGGWKFLRNFFKFLELTPKIVESCADYSGYESNYGSSQHSRPDLTTHFLAKMSAMNASFLRAVWALPSLFLALFTGCASFVPVTSGIDDYEINQRDLPLIQTQVDADGAVLPDPRRPPAELAKVSLPDYVIEPPDILLIEGVKIVPKTPYEIQPQDILQVVVLGTQPERPIAGQYLVEADGSVRLGPGYGTVRVSGLSTDEAEDAIRELLLNELQNPEVSVSLFQASGQQFITGEHLVAQDGTVNLGVYGRVYLAGMTLDEGREVLENHLSNFFDDPKVSLDVFVYNSKFYYVISEGAGLGEQTARIPITGNETVLDAISQIGGLGQASSKKIWISRPTPNACPQVLPVDWEAITRGASVATNYQLMPGDRLFIAENHLLAWSNLVSIMLNPVERVIGFTLLGAQTVQTVQRFPEGFNRFGQ